MNVLSKLKKIDYTIVFILLLLMAISITVLYSAAGRVRARIYGRTLMGRYTRNGYVSIRDTDVEIARMFVQVLEGKQN